MLNLTCIVLTYNRIDYTKKCIESFFKFAPPNHELIAIDNGSTDGTVEYLKELGIRVKFNKTNVYVAPAYVQGLKLCKPSKAYLLCDNDGLFDSTEWYTTGMKFFKKFPNAGIIGMRRQFNEDFDASDFSSAFGTKYTFSNEIATHSLIDNRSRKILIEHLKGKWVGRHICNLIKKHQGLDSILLYPGLITDMSKEDLDNEKYREMYLAFWKTKGRLSEFHRRIKKLQEKKCLT